MSLSDKEKENETKGENGARVDLVEPDVIDKKDKWEIISIGRLSELSKKKFRSIFPVAKGKFFLGDHLNLKTMDVSVNVLKPGYVNPYLHVHVVHEEVYIFLRGKGEMKLDDSIFEVKEGDIVRVSPEVKRGVRNPEGNDDELWFICIRAEEPFNRLDREGAGPVQGVDGWSLDKIIEKAEKMKKEKQEKNE